MFKRSRNPAVGARDEAYRKRRRRASVKRRRNRGTYRCARCNNIKRGHECSFQMVQSCSTSTQTGELGQAQAEVFVCAHSSSIRSPTAAPPVCSQTPTQTPALTAVWVGTTTQTAAAAPEICSSSPAAAASTTASLAIRMGSTAPTAAGAPAIWGSTTPAAAATPAGSGSTIPAAAAVPVVSGSATASDPATQSPSKRAFITNIAAPLVFDSDFDEQFAAIWDETVLRDSEISVANTEDNLILPVGETAGARNLTHLDHEQMLPLEGFSNLVEWLVQDSLDKEIDRAFQMENAELNFQGYALRNQASEQQRPL